MKFQKRKRKKRPPPNPITSNYGKEARPLPSLKGYSDHLIVLSFGLEGRLRLPYHYPAWAQGKVCSARSLTIERRIVGRCLAWRRFPCESTTIGLWLIGTWQAREKPKSDYGIDSSIGEKLKQRGRLAASRQENLLKQEISLNEPRAAWKAALDGWLVRSGHAETRRRKTP